MTVIVGVHVLVRVCAIALATAIATARVIVPADRVIVGKISKLLASSTFGANQLKDFQLFLYLTTFMLRQVL